MWDSFDGLLLQQLCCQIQVKGNTANAFIREFGQSAILQLLLMSSALPTFALMLLALSSWVLIAHQNPRTLN